MTQIRCIYSEEPKFPATDQHPDAVRYQVGANWVDAIGGEPTQAEIDAVLAPPIPQSVTPYQARAALLAAGLLDSVNAAVTKAGGQTQLAWEYATTVERSSTFIAAVQPTLGLSDAQVDALFVAATNVG